MLCGVVVFKPLGQGAKRRRRAPEQVHSDQVAFFSSPAPDQGMDSVYTTSAYAPDQRRVPPVMMAHVGAHRSLARITSASWRGFRKVSLWSFHGVRFLIVFWSAIVKT